MHIINARTSKVPCLMHLLRDLLMSAARFSFSFSVEHVLGVQNEIADALSRFHNTPSDARPAAAPGSVDRSTLEEHCLGFLAQGLVPSTRKSYSSAQRRFYEFCVQTG